jgi:hypothetical protein
LNRKVKNRTNIILKLIYNTVSDMTEAYEKSTAPTLPSPPPTPQPKRTQADWERDARELTEEGENRNALRHHDVPSYFHSELGKAFLLTQAPDMETLMKELSDDPRIEDEAAAHSNHSTPASPHPRKYLNLQNGFAAL